MATKSTHTKKTTNKDHDLPEIVGYEFLKSWPEARRHTQHRPSRH